MNELVFFESLGIKIDAFTTSRAIAEGTGIAPRKVNDAIQKHQKAFESFGVLASYQAETANNQTGGRKAKDYRLNEQQAAFLLTLLKNTPVVVEFKHRLVREFFKARQELATRHALREVGKPVQRELTDAISESGEDERMHGHAFNTYQNLIYKAALGRTASQVRRERGAEKNACAVDFLTSQELRAVEKKKRLVVDLLDEGMKYDDIRALLLRGVEP